MAGLSLFYWQQRAFVLITIVSLLIQPTHCFTGSKYTLDTEYSGANFFDGWDFFTGHDPTNGFVTYYDRSSSRNQGLIKSSGTTPAYMGVDFHHKLPVTSEGRANGAGRPSVRIESQRSWTHGLFIGDFDHAPSGICGTWPAFWTLGPNWPYTGEIDIFEGVNKMVLNGVALHTNQTCITSGDSTTQLGTLGNTDCATYPTTNVGCGVLDTRPASYSDFNSVGGGVYAMQWTSEYIRVWFFPRNWIPQDIINKTPDPSSWGLPTAHFAGNCAIDQHFQQHKLIFDTTFCGDYAGNPYVWDSINNSCKIATGAATCDRFVAENPGVFNDTYWSINYVRVYQLVNPDEGEKEPKYIASLQPALPTTQQPALNTGLPGVSDSLCPMYNFTLIETGGLTYEIECDFDPPGPDIAPPYDGYPVQSFNDCVVGCTYWNTVKGANLCGGVAYDGSDPNKPICYYKQYISQTPRYRKGFSGARLIHYGYPQITDDPRLQSPYSTSGFTEIIPTPQTYRPLTAGTVSSNTFTSFNTTSLPVPTIIAPPQGTPTNSSVAPSVESGIPTVSFSGTESVPVANLTHASSSPSTFVVSDPTRVTTSQLTQSIPATEISTQSTQTVTTSTAVTPLPPSSGTAPGPSAIAGYRYAGCKAVHPSSGLFTLAENASNMTLEHCTSACGASFYAGVYATDCYCAKSLLPDAIIVSYNDSACDLPCPGNPRQHCGGKCSANPTRAGSIAKRQNPNNLNIILLTLYYNTALVSGFPPTSTSTETRTLIHQSGSTTSGGVIYITTGTRTATATIISTTWCDYCPTCPEYQTTKSTAITIPLLTLSNNQQTVDPHLAVPMMMTTRKCNCGIKGAASTMTVTIPCETEISAMTNAFHTWNGLPITNSVALIRSNAASTVCHDCSHDVVAATRKQEGPVTPATTLPAAPRNASSGHVSTPAQPPILWPSSPLPAVFRPNVFSGCGNSPTRIYGMYEMVAAVAVIWGFDRLL